MSLACVYAYFVQNSRAGEWHIKLCVLPLQSPLYYIKTSEQLWHCYEKERALSSDASGFEYDTCIRKMWSNKQCVGLPCLYQIVRMDGAQLTATPLLLTGISPEIEPFLLFYSN